MFTLIMSHLIFMPKLQEPYILQDFSAGIIDDLSVADALTPRNAVRKGINVLFDRPRGAISQRYGTTALGAVVSSGNTINGLHNFRSSNSSYHQLLAAADTKIYSYNTGGATWDTQITGLTSGLKTRFLTYLDEVVYMNGTDASKSWTGTGAWQTTGGNLAVNSFPKAKFATILNSRVFTAGNPDAPDTVTASSLEASNAISL